MTENMKKYKKKYKNVKEDASLYATRYLLYGRATSYNLSFFLTRERAIGEIAVLFLCAHPSNYAICFW